MEDRRKMELGDWFSGAGLCIVGLYLGLVVHGLSLLVGTALFWPMLIFIMMMWGIMCLFDNVIGRFFGWMFPSGVKPATSPSAKERKPLARLLSLPCGIVLGVILGAFGLRDTLLFFT